jgi:alkanesulfonate monooxygenase SsuD/methylene tetrahydromethanopterin reductase-like flavin-dependent oxidoreductase (luciferase family)
MLAPDPPLAGGGGCRRSLPAGSTQDGETDGDAAAQSSANRSALLTAQSIASQAGDVAEGNDVWYTSEYVDRKGGSMRFRVEASVGNADGVFDAAYDFGDGSGEEAAVSGTPEEIAAAVARYLKSLSAEDCEAMRYGTSRFFVQLIVTPEETRTSEPG